MSHSISLRMFGYSMASSDKERHTALKLAIALHGIDKVIIRLEELKINSFYLVQTEKEIDTVRNWGLSMCSNILYTPENNKIPIPIVPMTPIKSIQVEHKSPETPTNSASRNLFGECNTHIAFVECMKVLNEKLCIATVAKDSVMINMMVESMCNVVRSSL